MAADATDYRMGLVRAGLPVPLLSCASKHRKRLVSAPFLARRARLYALSAKKSEMEPLQGERTIFYTRWCKKAEKQVTQR